MKSPFKVFIYFCITVAAPALKIVQGPHAAIPEGQAGSQRLDFSNGNPIVPTIQTVLTERNETCHLDHTVANEEIHVPRPLQDSINTTANNVCLEEGCVHIASFILKNLDIAVDPCENFYDFACGGYAKRTIIPDDKGAASVFEDVIDSLEERMRLALELETMDNENRAITMTKNLYRSCVNETLTAELGLQPLRDVLKDLGGWPVVQGVSWVSSNFSIVETLFKLRQIGFPIDTLFSFDVKTDKINSSSRSIELDQPDLGIKREYLIKGVDDSDVQAYLKYSTTAAVLLGADSATANIDMLEALLFEIQLANISSPREERRNITKLNNVRSIHDLQETTPFIPWLQYLNNIMPPSVKIGINEKLIVREPTFFQNITTLINQTNQRIIANYMLWRVVKTAATYLSEDIRGPEFLLKKKLEGQKTQLPRWKECVRKLQEKMPYGMGALYVRSYFEEDAKTQIVSMVQYLRNYFDEVLNSVDWMDEMTRSKALKKAKAIKPHIAFPEELVVGNTLEEYFSNLTVDTQSYLANILRVDRHKKSSEYAQLREVVDKSDWKLQASVAQVNAYYYWSENSIKLPAGIFQGIFFEPNFPKYVNFASIGLVIGHEITHGFDDTGKQFDGEGNLINWWEPETERKYLEKARCIIDQYSNYTLPENGLHLNGINSQGEDIADNGGTKESYMAYQQWVKDNGMEPVLPGLPYNSNQLFWISYAQKLCEKARPEYQKKQVLTGVHTPKRFRIVGPISNSENFAKDFKCPVGSKMNPAKKCSVW